MNDSQKFRDLDDPDFDDSLMYEVIIDGTHPPYVLYNGQFFSAECFNDNGMPNDCINFVDYQNNNYALLDSMQVIRDCSFYRNIGRYDQLVGGWDDLADSCGDPIWRAAFS